MKVQFADQSRDRRIEDLTNLWLIHPAGRFLLPWFVARRISANAISIAGLLLGTLAALAYARWQMWPFTIAGLLLSIGWLIADGLDGMVARATGTASPLGRALDGLCDHGVFILIYVVLALSLATGEGWALACAAGAAHALQSNIYEGERARFHRRCRGSAAVPPIHSRSALVRFYDSVAGAIDQYTRPFDEALRRNSSTRLADTYGREAAKPLRLMRLLSANVRVAAIFLACLVGHPSFFWWFEIIPLTAVLLIGFVWHRTVEDRLVRVAAAPSTAR